MGHVLILVLVFILIVFTFYEYITSTSEYFLNYILGKLDLFIAIKFNF